MPNLAELPGHLGEAAHASTNPSLLEGMRNLITWAAENPKWAAIPCLVVGTILFIAATQRRSGPLE